LTKPLSMVSMAILN